MIQPLHPVVVLAHAQMLRLADMSTVELRCLSGSLWLTLDNDPKDVVLEAGDSFVTRLHRPAIIYALTPASARLVPRCHAAPRRVAPWPQRLRKGFAGWLHGGLAAPS